MTENKNSKINRLLKRSILIVFVFGLILTNTSSALAVPPKYVANSSLCNYPTDTTNFPGQNCTPIFICGNNNGTAQCYDTTLISAPGSSVNSSTIYYGSLGGGYIANCNIDVDSLSAPYCGNASCNSDSTCFNTNHRQTQCLTGAWSGGGAGVSYNCDPSCVSGYYDCDGNSSNCETQNGGSCTVGIFSGTYSCTAGGSSCSTSAGGTKNQTCTCVLTKFYFQTGTETKYASSGATPSSVTPLLWGTEYGSDDLARLRNNIGGTSYSTDFEVGNIGTGVTANNLKVLNINNTNATFNTTAGDLNNYGEYIVNNATKSVLPNQLTNTGLYVQASGADKNYAIVVPANGGYVGIGTTTPTDALQVGSDALGGNIVQDAQTNWRSAFVIQRAGVQKAAIGMDSTDAKLQFFTGATSDDTTARLTVDSSGNVGIGTATPNARLDILASAADALRIEPYNTSAGNTGNLEFMELAANGSNYIGLKAPDNIASNIIWTLPATDGSSGQMLSTNGSGTLSWAAAAVSGITSLNGLTGATQTFATGTAGSDFGISSAGTVHTFNLPTASGTNRGLLSSGDWTTFNGKQTGSANLTSLAGLTYVSPSFVKMTGVNTFALDTNTYLTSSTGLLADGTVPGATLQSQVFTNGVTLPHMTSGSVLFAGTAGVVSQDNANFFWDNTSKRLGIGTATPLGELNVAQSGTVNAMRGISDIQYSNTVHSGILSLGKSRGTITSPTSVADGDFLGRIDFAGYGSTGFFSPVFIDGKVDGTVVGDTIPADMIFSTNFIERMRILDNGNVGIGVATPDNLLQVAGLINFDNTNNNTFLGYQTGILNTGFQNTATGYLALTANTAGYQNTAVGYEALTANTTGTANTALGDGALTSNTIGIVNVATGYHALQFNTTGSYNTAYGVYALQSNISGVNNVAEGYEALNANTTGSGNVAVGASALYNNVGSANIAVGYETLYTNTTGMQNTASGYQAMYSNNIGPYNSAYGYQSMYSATNPSYDTAVGMESLHSLTTGSYNVAVGAQALWSGTIEAYNTAVGYQALYNTTDYSNSALGYMALYSDIGGGDNTAVGRQALYSNTTGDYNTALGESALYSNNTKSNNSAFGYQALYSNTAGDTSNNSAFGYQALYSNTTGGSNVAVGGSALYHNTTGAGNVAVGGGALSGWYLGMTGSLNTAVGGGTLYNDSTGANNTAVGYTALQNNTIGSNNTAVGLGALSGDSLLHNTGGANTAVGNIALAHNTIGSNNTANGDAALNNNTSGSYNTANGVYALQNNTTGDNNTAYGNAALYRNNTGSGNVALGNYAGYYETTDNNSFYVNNVDESNPTNDKAYSLMYGTFSGTPGVLTGQQLVINGNVGINTASPTARLQLPAGTAVAGTAPLKFTAGTNLGAPEAGATEFDGTQLYLTNSTPTRNMLAQVSGITPMTAGSVAFASASGYLAQDNANFFWDNTNKRLGIGTATPSAHLDIVSASPADEVKIEDGTYAVNAPGLPSQFGLGTRIGNIAGGDYWTFEETAVPVLGGITVAGLKARDSSGTKNVGYIDGALGILENGGPVPPSINFIDSTKTKAASINWDSSAETFTMTNSTHITYVAAPGIADGLTLFNEKPGLFVPANDSGDGESIVFRNNPLGPTTNVGVGRITGILTDNTNGAWKGELAFYTNNNTVDPTEAMRLDYRGYLGIGTTTPDNRLQVANLIDFDNVGFNTKLGYYALTSNTGTYNTAVGYNALYANTTGANNTAIGYYALRANNTGIQNTANGYMALNSNISGDNNTAVGWQALTADTAGFNTAIGYHALGTNTIGTQNTANGVNALGHNTEGNGNTASGFRALLQNTIGSNNTAYGWNALGNNTIGNNNIAIGVGALYYFSASPQDSGSQNVAIGINTLAPNTGGSNTAIGDDALASNTTGNKNTAIGESALTANIDGSGNVAIGYLAGHYEPHSSDSFYVNNHDTGNNDGTNSLLYGVFDSTTNDPTKQFLRVNGGLIVLNSASAPTPPTNGELYYNTGDDNLYLRQAGAWQTITTSSSLRYKHDIQPLSEDWTKILQVQPISFIYNDQPDNAVHIGYVAEDFEALGLTNLLQYDGQGRPSGINYDKITLYDTEIIKQQQIDINAIKTQLGMPIENVAITPAGTSGSGEVPGVVITPFDQSIQASLSKLGATLSDGVLSLKQVITDTLTVKTARINRMEMVDSATGGIYCTWVENGEWKKVQGDCASVTGTTPVETTTPPDTTLEGTTTPSTETVTPPTETTPTTTTPLELNDQASQQISQQLNDLSQQLTQQQQANQQALQQTQGTADQAQQAAQQAQQAAQQAQQAAQQIQQSPEETTPQSINIISVAHIPDINVDYGTSLASANLPTTVAVTLSDNSTQTVTIVWDNGMPTYNPEISGTYVFSGTLTFSGNVTNTNNLNANVNVIVAQHPISLEDPLSVTSDLIKNTVSDLFNGAGGFIGGVIDSGSKALSSLQIVQKATSSFIQASSFLQSLSSSFEIKSLTTGFFEPIIKLLRR